MSEPNTTIHNETTQLPPDNGGNAGQPAATAAEPKNDAQPTGEQPAPAAPTKVEEPAAAPSSPHVGFVARAKENWDVAVAGAAIGVAAGFAVGALCFGGKSEEAAVVV